MKHEQLTKGLGRLGALADKTQKTEVAIHKAAISRLDAVQSELNGLFPGIEGKSGADQSRYLELVRERGKLHGVIARAASVA